MTTQNKIPKKAAIFMSGWKDGAIGWFEGLDEVMGDKDLKAIYWEGQIAGRRERMSAFKEALRAFGIEEVITLKALEGA